MSDDEGPAVEAARALASATATPPWPHPIYAGLRRRGRRLWHGWSEGDPRPWLAAARHAHPEADLLELCLPRHYVACRVDRPAPPSWTGIFGIEVRDAGRVARMSPGHMIASNRTWQRALDECRRLLGLEDGAGTVFRVQATTMIFPLDGSGPPYRFERSGRPVTLEEITPEATADLAHALGRWLVRNTDDSGRLTYKYWPSRGRISPADNTVRQFMGTLALGRYARWSGLPEAAAAAERNLACQMRRFHRRMPEGFDVIEHGGSAKLGAAAIAGLCLIEAAPDAGRREALAGLARGIEALWRPDGSFRTFHFPADRNDNQNFYPGEAALFWATLHARDRDPAVLARLLRTLDYYRDWHRRNRNPAFIPWHLQAHAALFHATGFRDRLAFAFEMADWLLPMQQWESAPADDMRGRFYHLAHPEYGPPHAASTGAYLEGLVAAAGLARAVGDDGRAGRYQLAIRRGVRSIRQLAFHDESDFLYVSRHNRVKGGVRTEVYDNTIRVDNVQHALMAILTDLQSSIGHRSEGGIDGTNTVGGRVARES